MARNRRRTRERSEETSDFSNDLKTLLRSPSQSPYVVQPLVHHTSPSSQVLSDIEDRRTWHPQAEQRPARSFDRPTHSLVVPRHPKNVNKSRAGASALPHQVQFDAPNKVLVCVRRAQRKQVLFALKKTGKGAKARKHRRSYYSDIRC